MSPLETARRLRDVAARWLRRTAARRALPRSGPYWVTLELASPVPDAPGRFPAERAQTLLGVLETLEAIAREPARHVGQLRRQRERHPERTLARQCASRGRAAQPARGRIRQPARSVTRIHRRRFRLPRR